MDTRWPASALHLDTCRFRYVRSCRSNSTRGSVSAWPVSSAPNVRISVAAPGPRDAEQPLEVAAARQQRTVQLLKLPYGVGDREQPARLGGHPGEERSGDPERWHVSSHHSCEGPKSAVHFAFAFVVTETAPCSPDLHELRAAGQGAGAGAWRSRSPSRVHDELACLRLRATNPRGVEQQAAVQGQSTTHAGYPGGTFTLRGARRP